ncbi:transcriptional regulator [Pseudomonas asuensis]|uniref:Transcriptional regulator n=1 Tax=Pseudomonas asuensis TaxID=1825787 RepID=A0ABQ2GFY4_9PSED|nr:Cd(II)/Pb(II)-responsive transcriptional regulator [Pseudomonas asuensis]GGL94594.1 transcriptional regulator [Pseudomonas asuensis]
MKIGELANRTGCSVETIRYYEREGLLPPAVRTAGNYRQYSEAHLERLTFVRHCRSLDMTQDEIRSLLRLRDQPEPDCCQVNDLIDDHIHHVEVRIQELTDLRRQLTELRQHCSGKVSSDACGIIRELEQPAGPSATREVCSHAGHDHVPGAHKR